MAVRTGGHVYLFEFKVVEMSPPGSALARLQLPPARPSRGHATKLTTPAEEIS